MKFTEPPMRAPQEIHSLILQATPGCTYGKCNFCYTSRGYLFMAVKPEDMEKAALAQKPCFPSSTPIYLTGANPFALAPGAQAIYRRVTRAFPVFYAEKRQGHRRHVHPGAPANDNVNGHDALRQGTRGPDGEERRIRDALREGDDRGVANLFGGIGHGYVIVCS